MGIGVSFLFVATSAEKGTSIVQPGSCGQAPEQPVAPLCRDTYRILIANPKTCHQFALTSAHALALLAGGAPFRREELHINSMGAKSFGRPCGAYLS